MRDNVRKQHRYIHIGRLPSINDIFFTKFSSLIEVLTF